MSERSMSKLVMEVIRHLDPVRVENSAHPGTPDINYVDGWIELKELDGWPKREGTIVRVEHFSNEQRIWLDRRWRSGGEAWLLLKVEQDWLLLAGDVSARILGKVTKSELFDAATQKWHGSAYKDDLAKCLSRLLI